MLDERREAPLFMRQSPKNSRHGVPARVGLYGGRAPRLARPESPPALLEGRLLSMPFGSVRRSSPGLRRGPEPIGGGYDTKLRVSPTKQKMASAS
jgi:hypothetical protein